MRGFNLNQKASADKVAIHMDSAFKSAKHQSTKTKYPVHHLSSLSTSLPMQLVRLIGPNFSVSLYIPPPFGIMMIFASFQILLTKSIITFFMYSKSNFSAISCGSDQHQARNQFSTFQALYG
jgi:hypothetical protein